MLKATQIGTPSRAFALHLAQLPRHIRNRQMQSLQTQRVERNFNLSVRTTHAGDCANAFDGQQTAGHGLVDKPAQTFVVQLGSCDGKSQDGSAGEFKFAHHRVEQIGGQVASYTIDGRAHFVKRLLYRLFNTEFAGDEHIAILDLGVQVFQTRDGDHGILNFSGDLGFHLHRCRTWQSGSDDDGGQIQVGEVLHLHMVEGQQTSKSQQYKQHHRGDGVANRPSGNVHGLAAAGLLAAGVSATTLTKSPAVKKPAPRTTTLASAGSPEVTSSHSPWRRPKLTL